MAKRFIDGWCPVDRFHTLALIVVLIMVAMLLKGFFEFWQESLVGSVVNKSLYDMRNHFYRKVIHLDVNHFQPSGTHELMARFTNDIEMLGTGTKTLFGKVVAEPLRAVACVVVACWISWQLTVMFLVLVPVGLYVLTSVGRMMKRATRRQLERMSAIYKILQETFLNIRMVKAFTRESTERRRFRSRHQGILSQGHVGRVSGRLDRAGHRSAGRAGRRHGPAGRGVSGHHPGNAPVRHSA